MDTSIAIPEILRSLPADRLARALALQRLAEECAAREAAAALRASIARAPATLREVLAAASELWDGESSRAVRPHEAERRQELARALASPAFTTLASNWVAELRALAVTHPDTGACTVASAIALWMWTFSHVEQTFDAATRDTAIVELAEAFCGLLAARCQILDVVHGEQPGPGRAGAAAPGATEFYADLCRVHAARAASVVGTRCAEIVFGYRRHQVWDAEGCATCYRAGDVDALEGLFPGFGSSARAYSDVIEEDGSHAAKAGPCAQFAGVESFLRLRTRLDGCLTGARLARDRAAEALPRVLGR